MINKQTLNYKIMSILLMLIALIIFVILITYNETDYSYNSTSMYNINSGIYVYRNIVADFLFQVFGQSIYIMPVFLLFWSYKLFLLKAISFYKLRLIAVLLCLILMPYLVYTTISEYSGGVLGFFISSILQDNYMLLYILVIVTIVLVIIALGFNISDYVQIYFMLLYAIEYIKYKYQVIVIKNNSNKNKPSIRKTSIRTTPDINEIKKDISDLSEERIIKNIHNEDIQDMGYIKEPDVEEYEKQTFDPIDYEVKKEQLNTQPVKNIEASIKKGNNTQPILNNYNIPIDFLQLKQNNDITINNKEIKENAIKLETIIKEFGINGKIVNIKTGPVVTLYEITIPAGVKTSKLVSLETDIALRMKAVSVRIAIVAGKDVMGVEIPNKNRKTIYLKEVFNSKEFQETTAKLPMALGYDIYGKSVIADLVTMPHVLIAGTTGSGKSVGVNSMILSMLYKLPPDKCKLIMIDPKMLELSVYQDIPHLLSPVVTNPKQAVSTLKWVVKEMEYRYYQMSLLGVRNIIGFNEKVQNSQAIGEAKANIFAEKGININFQYMPYIVVIIDEMADLMIVAGKEVESAVQRLAQMARASGIHLIMATQRPSVDVITGTIKANFPTRISFQVSSKIDSRTILGEQGAEQLLGRGDMLYMSGVGRIQRVHGPFVADDEVTDVVNYLKSLGKPTYIETTVSSESSLGEGGSEDKDELYDEALSIIQEEGKASTSFLQRKFQIGYNRAARIMEQLEQNGVVSKATMTGKREVLIK